MVLSVGGSWVGVHRNIRDEEVLDLRCQRGNGP